jgi:type III pantothenate kinase
VDTFRFEEFSIREVEEVFEAYPQIGAAIIISSREADDIKERVGSRVGKFVDFSSATPVPIENLYRTPHTLGPDRLAAAVGAATLYPATNVLVVDFGSAITIDMISARGEFLGGNISPGAAMRFRALNAFTNTLPLLSLSEHTELLSLESATAMESGVANGIVYEIEGYIARLKGKFDPLKIIFTGGDGNFFAKRFKNPIFATYDLVAYGLNSILEYNAH